MKASDADSLAAAARAGLSVTAVRGASEVLEGHCRERLKKAGMLFKLFRLHQSLRSLFDAAMHFRKFGIADCLTVDSDALVHAHKMRGSV